MNQLATAKKRFPRGERTLRRLLRPRKTYEGARWSSAKAQLAQPRQHCDIAWAGASPPKPTPPTKAPSAAASG